MHDNTTRCACTDENPIACKGPTRDALHVAFGSDPCPCPGHASPMAGLSPVTAGPPVIYQPALDSHPAPHATVLPIVQCAVQHLLDQAQQSGDLGYLIAPFSQSFELLCQAESALTGETLASVRERRGKKSPDASARTLFRREEILDELKAEAIGRSILGGSQ